MEQRYKAEMINVLDKHITARSYDNRDVLLFGHCNATEEMADYLLSHKINPRAILDNSISKQGLCYREIPITAPEATQGFCKNNSIVLIATRFFAEMSAQLRRLGYEGEIIKAVDYNSFAEYSLSNETLERKRERVLRGMQTLEKIRLEYSAHHLVICPNDALGDVYWAMSFLPAYCEKRAICDVCIVVIGERGRQVADLFGVASIITLGHEEMDELVQAIIFSGEDNCIIAQHDRPYTDNIIRYLDKYFLSFIDYYRYAVFGLSADSPVAMPTNYAAFDNCAAIPKGKSAIISPYAKSVVQLPDSFWETIIAEQKDKGYRVYTNIRGDETPLSGTLPLTIPIAQTKSAAEYAGVFIGVRNGLCDLVHTAKCRKIVIFPDCYYSTTPHKVERFFDLPGWEKIICT